MNPKSIDETQTVDSKLDAIHEIVSEHLGGDRTEVEVIGEPAVIMNKARVEALSDGVFAIVMTLLVIEIKVPEMHFEHGIDNGQLLEKLQEISPLFASYFLSFSVLAMLWLSHHYLFHSHIRTVDRVVILLNIIYLCFLSLIPFTSHLLVVYLNSPLVLTVYGVNILLVSLINLCLYYYAWHAPHIVNGKVSNRLKKQATIRMYLTIVSTVLGIVSSYIYIPLSIFFYLFPVILNTIPGLLTLILERILRFRIN